MSEPIDRDKAPDSGVDVFSMKPSSKSGEVASQGEAGAAATSTRATGSGWATKVGPVHFAAVAVLIAGVWIGWPYASGGSAASGQLANSSQMLMPSDPRMARTGERLGPPAARAPNAVDAVAGLGPTAAPAAAATAPAPAPAIAPASMVAQPSARETELQAMVGELQSKLAIAEAQAAACTPLPAQATVAAFTPPQKPRPKLQDVSASRRVVATRVAPDRNEETPALRDYTLNTVYRDQAWIQGAERTYVVRAGDVIDGVRIVRVDPRARQVVTSRGVIR